METIICEVCGNEIPKDDAYEVGEGSGIFVCEECFEKDCVKCDRCGEIIFSDASYHTGYGKLCDCCYDDLFG